LNKCVQAGVLAVPVELETGAVEGFYREFDLLLDGSPELIELDCSNLEHVTSSHINLLWEALSLSREASVRLRLTSPPGVLIRVLKALDLEEFFLTGRDDDEYDGSSGCVGVPELTDPVEQFEISFSPDTDEISRMRSDFKDYLRQVGLPDKCALELQSVFYETSANIAEHAQLADGDRIEFSARRTETGFWMRFVDPGRPFDPTSVSLDYMPEAAAVNRRRRGLGLVMIKRMTNDIKYERRDNRYNVLILTKTRNQR